MSKEASPENKHGIYDADSLKVFPWSPNFVSKPGTLRDESNFLANLKLDPSPSRAVENGASQPNGKESLPKLFQPTTIRGVTLKNRVVVPPMCMYTAREGTPTDYHFVHYGKLAMGGAGLIIVEATGVVLDGRISPYCLSFHDDAQIPVYKRIVDYAHANGTIMAIQLGHAGRKASTPATFQGRAPTIMEGPESWADRVVAPSPIPYAADWVTPRELTVEEILDIQQSFVDAVKRSAAAGFDVIEIHAAHGYLMHNFYSPASNTRTDQYGGSLENRMRMLLETTEKIRAIWSGPLLVRLSASDWLPEGGWTVDDSVELSKRLKALGVDIIDVSSGGNVGHARMEIKPGYQVAFSERIRKEADIPTIAVGLITDPKQAEEILQNGQADFVGLARQHLRDSLWTFTAAKEFGVNLNYTPQFQWCLGK